MKLPARESVEMVLQFCDLSPRGSMNGPQSRQLDNAIMDLSNYFRAMYEPTPPAAPPAAPAVDAAVKEALSADPPADPQLL